MRYKTELHCHSAPVSTCSLISPEEIIRKYSAAGYQSVVLSNHFSRVTFKNMERTGFPDTWDGKVDYFMSDYRRFEAAAHSAGISPIFGAEVRLDCHAETDFLLFGVTEDYLRQTPDLLSFSVREFSASVRGAGILLFQAHPFRNGMVVTDPRLLDGLEVYNAHPGQHSRNDFAELWADRFHLLKSSGTDLHAQDYPIGGGIETAFPVTDSKELLSVLKSGAYTLIKAGQPGLDN